MRARCFFGTLWDSSDEAILRDEPYKYLLISDLDHTEDGKEHKHVFIQYKNAKRKFPPTKTVHWEVPKSISGCLKYIYDKGPNFFEDGECGLDKKKNDDWQLFVSECEKCTPAEIIKGPFSRLYAQYRGFAGEIHNTFNKPERLDGELHNLWLYGRPGTGKTKYAWDNFPNLYIKSINKWWDGYNGEEVVLLDDWDPKHEVLVSHLKIWADRYPFRGETKGSSLVIRPKMIVITSNYSIRECFTSEADIQAIKRRFKSIHFDTLGTTTE